MIYTASYFEPNCHHGAKISVSRSVPQGFKIDGKLPFLAPSSPLHKDWKAKRLDESTYAERYRTQILKNWSQVKQWLEGLQPSEHITLLCWEQSGIFCHRYLIAKLIEKHRSDCFGGTDVVRNLTRIEMPRCKQCSSRVIPGLDGSYCLQCRNWLRSCELES